MMILLRPRHKGIDRSPMVDLYFVILAIVRTVLSDEPISRYDGY